MINKIKKTLGKQIVIDPIVDICKYLDNSLSFAGNSLAESNVLFITNKLKQDNLMGHIKAVLMVENCLYSVLMRDRYEFINGEDIVKSGKELLGPYDHIINFYQIDKSDDGSSILKVIYQHLQTETQYMIDHANKGSICTVVLYDSDISDEIKATIKGAEALMKGLGIVLPNHKIIANGIIAQDGVPFSNLAKTAIYLSSKYGQLLTGEVLIMNKPKCEESYAKF